MMSCECDDRSLSRASMSERKEFSELTEPFSLIMPLSNRIQLSDSIEKHELYDDSMRGFFLLFSSI